jgi:hypothetical protein
MIAYQFIISFFRNEPEFAREYLVENAKNSTPETVDEPTWITSTQSNPGVFLSQKNLEKRLPMDLIMSPLHLNLIISN